MGLKLHHVKALSKVGEWVIWDKLAICNTFRDNSHLLILSRWIISYGSETSQSESSAKSRWMSYLAICNTFREKLAICNTFRDNSHLLILSRWNFTMWISYGSETSLHMKALPVVNELFEKNWVSAILLPDNSAFTHFE